MSHKPEQMQMSQWQSLVTIIGNQGILQTKKPALFCSRKCPGILLSGLTIEDMKQGTSRIRNYVIARVFRELHLIEDDESQSPFSRSLQLPNHYCKSMRDGFREPAVLQGVEHLQIAACL